MVTNPYQAYQQNAMTTASPGELTLMLYNGCLKFISQGKKAIVEKNYEDKHTNIMKAQNIITELMVTLKTDELDAGDNMLLLYDFIKNKLIEANTKNSMSALEDAEKIVIDFRDTWKQVIQLHRQQQYASSGSRI